MGNSFAEYCERLDEEEKQQTKDHWNAHCPYSSRHTNRDCKVKTEHAKKDVCETCGRVWTY